MPQPAEFSWRTVNILIADDEPDMREIFAAWLRNLGCTVTEAADGREALEALARNTFDAIVTDVRMPRVDGIQLVHHLHNSRTYVPVIIFVSGFVDLPLPDAYDLGVEGVLSKPCARQDLIDTLRRCILRRHLIFEPDQAAFPGGPECILHDFPGAIKDSSVALGRGGFSVDAAPDIGVGSAVRFSFSFGQGGLRSLRGRGLIRWCETITDHYRAGIEFMDLEQECRDSFKEWLERTRPGSFIPKNALTRNASHSSG